jgi:hypothetical protein
MRLHEFAYSQGLDSGESRPRSSGAKPRLPGLTSGQMECIGRLWRFAVNWIASRRSSSLPTLAVGANRPPVAQCPVAASCATDTARTRGLLARSSGVLRAACCAVAVLTSASILERLCQGNHSSSQERTDGKNGRGADVIRGACTQLLAVDRLVFFVVCVVCTDGVWLASWATYTYGGPLF